jgi:hypothetical protein
MYTQIQNLEYIWCLRGYFHGSIDMFISFFLDKIRLNFFITCIFHVLGTEIASLYSLSGLVVAADIVDLFLHVAHYWFVLWISPQN